MIVMAVGEESEEDMLNNYSKHEPTFREFSPLNHLTKDDPPMYLAYDGDLTLPAKSYGHAIHHGLYGVKFKERSEQLGHNRVHLAAGEKYRAQYSSPHDFVIKTLLRARSE